MELFLDEWHDSNIIQQIIDIGFGSFIQNILMDYKNSEFVVNPM